MEASALSAPAGLGRISVSGPLLRLRSDEQLVALFRAGNDEAFRAIHDRYRQRLFAYTRQMLAGSRSDAEDALQDVFLRAYHALRADGRPITLRAWLYRVAHNRCIDDLRRPAPAAADVFDLNRGPLHDPIAEAERREDLRRLIADVRGLPETQRSALLMRELEGLTYAELGDALGVSIPAVKSLLVRARIGLVEAIEARDTSCGDIRSELCDAHDRGVRDSGRARRHLRECVGCREYRTALRGQRSVAALSPGPGPLATLAKLLGIGGAGSGAAAGGTAAAGSAVATGGLSTVGTGAVAATASKVVAVVAAAAVVGGGAAEVKHQVARHTAPQRAAAVPVTKRVVTPIAAAATEVLRRREAAAQPHERRRAARMPEAVAPAATLPADDPMLGDPATDPTAVDVAAASGGILAPPESTKPVDESGAGAAPPAEPSAGADSQSDAGAGGATGTAGDGTGTTTADDGPTGQSTGGPAPVAQGAAAPSQADG